MKNNIIVLIVACLFCLQGCSAQNRDISPSHREQGNRISHSIGSVLSVLLSNISTGHIDARNMGDTVRTTITNEAQSEVWDQYYDESYSNDLEREREEKYSQWARQRDLERNVNRVEDEYRARYDDERRRGIR